MRKRTPLTFLAGCRSATARQLGVGLLSAIALIQAMATPPGQAAAQAKFVEEGGDLPDGTEYLIRMPSNWIGTLIRDLDYASGSSHPRWAALLEKGYALSGTGRHRLRLYPLRSGAGDCEPRPTCSDCSTSASASPNASSSMGVQRRRRRAVHCRGLLRQDRQHDCLGCTYSRVADEHLSRRMVRPEGPDCCGPVDRGSSHSSIGRRRPRNRRGPARGVAAGDQYYGDGGTRTNRAGLYLGLWPAGAGHADPQPELGTPLRSSTACPALPQCRQPWRRSPDQERAGRQRPAVVVEHQRRLPGVL